MLEYYFSKEFVMLKRNSINLKIIGNKAKQIVHAIDMNDSKYIMTCITVITYISNTLKKLLLQLDLH